MNLSLNDSGELIFYRVLHGLDFPTVVINHLKSSIKGRGLAAAGRTGHQYDSIGAPDQTVNLFTCLRAKPQALELQLDIGAIEDS